MFVTMRGAGVTAQDPTSTCTISFNNTRAPLYECPTCNTQLPLHTSPLHTNCTQPSRTTDTHYNQLCTKCALNCTRSRSNTGYTYHKNSSP